MLVEPLELELELDAVGVGASTGLVEVVTGTGAGFSTAFSSVPVPPVEPPAGGDPPLTAAGAPQLEGAWMMAGWAV